VIFSDNTPARRVSAIDKVLSIRERELPRRAPRLLSTGHAFPALISTVVELRLQPTSLRRHCAAMRGLLSPPRPATSATATSKRLRRHVLVVVFAMMLVAPLLVLTASPAQPQPKSARWTWPLDDRRVIRPFLAPLRPWGPGHRGVDLAGARGGPVRAVGPGTVTFAGMIAGRGVITVRHGELRTTYEPVQPVVKPGDSVAGGSQIGHLSPGGHCVPQTCLHLGLLSGARYLDPMTLFQPVRVRLLPLSSNDAMSQGGRSGAG
jgi:murein DD-endopeptidase MepM/ murein hydrolase activator NlpD